MSLMRAIRFLPPLLYAATAATTASANHNNDALAAPAALQLANEDGRMVKLVFAAGQIPLQAKGGFQLMEFPAKRVLRLHDAAAQAGSEGRWTFRAKADELTLEAALVPKADGSIRVAGVLTNSRQGDRAILLRYTLPIEAEGGLFDYGPAQSLPIRPDAQGLGTIFPLAALTNGKACVALGIPPDFPCCFGITGSAEGLGLEFYLGIVPETKHFPNQARFEFLIFSALPAAPFRSALTRYYEFFPDYYTPRVKGGGFWNKHEPGNIDAALPLYRFQVLGGREIQPCKSRNLLSFHYLLVGQRSLKGLPELPKNYEAAMKVFEQFGRQKSPDTAASDPDDAPVSHELIEHCACKDAGGRYVLHKIGKGASTAEGDEATDAGTSRAARRRARRDAAGKDGGGAKSNSLTFLVNPNPELFADRGWDTVGEQTIRRARELLASEPLDGFEFDSLGGRWPATLNFRRDHFVYARYPLTFDPQGRVALHNCTSHYECVQTLRSLVRAQGKYLFGNGIYTYARKPGTDRYEHYHSDQNGRFFLAALLDIVGRENSTLFSQQDLLRMRAMAGRKLAAMVMYNWKDPQLVHDQINRNLVYAIFGTPSDKSSGYVVSPAFARDKQLLQWFVAHCRLLHEAGWEPVTCARPDSPEVACERYGHGEKVYFAMINFADTPRDCQLAIDLQPLAMVPAAEAAISLREIARNANITKKFVGTGCVVGLHLPPNEAHIIELRRN